MLNPWHDDDRESGSDWGISNYPAHVPFGLPMPPRDEEPERPDSEWVL